MTSKPIRTALLAAAATVATGVATGLAATPAVAEGAILYEGSPRAVPGSYIVVPTKGTTLDAAGIAGEYGAAIRFRYGATLGGFAVETSAAGAKRLAADPRVAYVAQDLTVSLADARSTNVLVQPNPPSWGLDRVDQRSLPLDLKYFHPSTAASARAYIIDTGIRFTHREFGGRAIPGFDAVGGVTPPGFDCNGHGTSQAGTVGGATVGLAKAVTLLSVRVLSCTGSASFSQVIAGVDWVTQHNRANPRPSVASLPIGGNLFQPLNDAVTASIEANVHYSVAAGGSNTNACNFSPASAPRATTVGSTDRNDSRATFSNFGPCVDLFAPGVGITTASATADDAYVTLSGTGSVAHAAGAAALWRHKFPADNADRVAAALVANATPVVGSPGTGSPNLLLFMGMIPV